MLEPSRRSPVKSMRILGIVILLLGTNGSTSTSTRTPSASNRSGTNTHLSIVACASTLHVPLGSITREPFSCGTESKGSGCHSSTVVSLSTVVPSDVTVPLTPSTGIALDSLPLRR